MPNKMHAETTRRRKIDHLNIARDKAVSFKAKRTGFEDMDFDSLDLEYRTLPEINKREIALETRFLGKKLSAPLLVSGMTGGAAEARDVNRDIAKAVQALGLGMGVGSQRAMIEDPTLTHTYQVRDLAPDAYLAGNIGIAQLIEYPIEKIEAALKAIGADALAIHLNAAQEAVQPEGDTDFAGALKAVKHAVRKLDCPVVVKEVGHGFDFATAKALARTGIAAIDVQGAGGTSWTAIESFRKKSAVGETYWDWGIPTAVSLVNVRRAFKGPVIASGGMRTGLDCVKAFALGADLCSMARPVFLVQQKSGAAGVQKFLAQVIEEMRTGLFLIGVKNARAARKRKTVFHGRLNEWVMEQNAPKKKVR